MAIDFHFQIHPRQSIIPPRRDCAANCRSEGNLDTAPLFSLPTSTQSAPPCNRAFKADSLPARALPHKVRLADWGFLVGKCLRRLSGAFVYATQPHLQVLPTCSSRSSVLDCLSSGCQLQSYPSGFELNPTAARYACLSCVGLVGNANNISPDFTILLKYCWRKPSGLRFTNCANVDNVRN